MGTRGCWKLWIRNLSTTFTSGATKSIAIHLGPQKATLLGAIPYFLPLLLISLFGWPRFCFDSFGTVGLTISRAKSKGGEVVVDFFRYSL